MDGARARTLIRSSDSIGSNLSHTVPEIYSQSCSHQPMWEDESDFSSCPQPHVKRRCTCASSVSLLLGNTGFAPSALGTCTRPCRRRDTGGTSKKRRWRQASSHLPSSLSYSHTLSIPSWVFPLLASLLARTVPPPDANTPVGTT